jgi:hypothetical protein
MWVIAAASAYLPIGSACPSRNRHHRACFQSYKGVVAPPLVTVYDAPRRDVGDRENSPFVSGLRISGDAWSASRRLRLYPAKVRTVL